MSLQEEVSRVKQQLSLHFRELHQQLDEREKSLLEDIERDLSMKVQQKELDLIGYSAVLDAVSVIPEMVGGRNRLKGKVSRLNEFNFKVKVIWDDFKAKQEIDKIGDFKFEIGDEDSVFDEKYFSFIPDFYEQKDIIKKSLDTPLKKGDKWFLIDMKWFKIWQKFMEHNSFRQIAVKQNIPGPIDNTGLLDQGVLSKKLVDEIDFKLVPKAAWNNLVFWYDQAEDSIPLSRPVIESGTFLKQLRIEIYPLELQASLYPNQYNTKSVSISRSDPISSLYSKVMTQFSIPIYTPVKLFNRICSGPYNKLEHSPVELQNAGVFDGQSILLQTMLPDGSWPEDGWNVSREIGFTSQAKKQKLE